LISTDETKSKDKASLPVVYRRGDQPLPLYSIQAFQHQQGEFFWFGVDVFFLPRHFYTLDGARFSSNGDQPIPHQNEAN
jgi:hypothetical protein